jgi:hypothetical protein
VPAVVVDLRDGKADLHRVCSRCGTEDVVSAQQE